MVTHIDASGQRNPGNLGRVDALNGTVKGFMSAPTMKNEIG